MSPPVQLFVVASLSLMFTARVTAQTGTADHAPPVSTTAQSASVELGTIGRRVAAATEGLTMELHMPKDGMFVIGMQSAIFSGHPGCFERLLHRMQIAPGHGDVIDVKLFG